MFSLTPAGTLRWTNPETYSRPIVQYAEIVFGLNSAKPQLYFYANQHLRALGLDGSSVFTVPGGPRAAQSRHAAGNWPRTVACTRC